MNASDAVGEAIFFLLLLCWLVLLPAWTYRDAKKNNFNPKICLLLVLFCPEGTSLHAGFCCFGGLTNERVEKVAAPHFSRARVLPARLRFAGWQNPQSTKTKRFHPF